MVGSINVLIASNDQYVKLVNIQGKGGCLNGIGVSGGINRHYFRITIDGRIIVDDNSLCVASRGSQNNGFPVNLTFNQNLLVEVKDLEPSGVTEYWVSYTVNGSSFLNSSEYEEKIGDMSYIFKKSTYLSDDNKEFAIEENMGPRFKSKILLDGDVIFRDGKIHGIIELADYKKMQNHLRSIEVVLRPIGFTSVLSRTKTSFLEHYGFFFYYDDVKFNGIFEIIAKIPGYANQRAVVLLL